MLALVFLSNCDFVTAREVLPAWDKNIQSLCYQVNHLIEKISNAAPDWISKAMDDQMVQ